MNVHTPGPWVSTEKLDGRGWVAVGVGTGRTLAEVIASGDTPDTRLANARVMAAGPTMLEALEEVFAFFARAGYPKAAAIAYEKTRNAIARAKDADAEVE